MCEWYLTGSQAVANCIRESPGFLIGVCNLSWLPLWVKIGGLENCAKLVCSCILQVFWACGHVSVRGGAGTPRRTVALRVAPKGAWDWKLDQGPHRTEGSKHLGHLYLNYRLVNSQLEDPSLHFVTLLRFSYTQKALLTWGYTKHQQGQNIITSY